ncbi:helix-turn-helix domain-containing protein [soil metagenome]
MSENLNTLLESLIKFPKETEWIEFKQNSFIPEEFGEYLSALSNSALLHDKEYAYIVFGVEDGSHNIVGTKINLLNEKIGSQELENWAATQLAPRIDFKIYQFDYNNLPISLVRIDSAKYLPVRFKSIEFVRVGTYKKKLMDHPEKSRKLWAKCSGFVFEEQIAKKSLTADEVINLLDYPAYFDLIKLNLPTNKKGIIEKFIEEKLIICHGDLYDITNLGAILFAKDLKNFDKLSRKAVRVIQYKGKNKVNTIKEQLGTKGYATGFQGLISYINDQLPSNEEIGRTFREEVKMYPEIAVRELVANALIHQDFTESGAGPMIEIYEDRIEITNPGKPLISPLRFIDHTPQSRNEALAQFMRRVYICEERGSGYDKVIFNIELYQLPAVKIIDGDNYLNVIIYAYKSLRQMDKEDKIRACYQHACLKYVSSNTMTNQSLRERFGITEKNYSTVSRIISDTIDAKLVKYEDPENKSKRFANYVPIWA